MATSSKKRAFKNTQITKKKTSDRKGGKNKKCSRRKDRSRVRIRQHPDHRDDPDRVLLALVLAWRPEMQFLRKESSEFCHFLRSGASEGGGEAKKSQ